MSLLLQTKSFFETLKFSVYNSRKSSKRGVSEIIGALLLLGITMSAGVLVFVLVQGNEPLNFVTSGQQTINPNVIPKLILSGYDTRDAANLYNLNNIVNNKLKPSTSVDSLSTSNGVDNEFIILKVRNDSDTRVEITGITINEEDHIFDSGNSASPLTNLTLPDQGKFIIISGTGSVAVIQELLSFLPEASEKRIIIRLNDALPDPGIALNSKIRVVINSSAESTQLLLVPAGRLA